MQQTTASSKNPGVLGYAHKVRSCYKMKRQFQINKFVPEPSVPARHNLSSNLHKEERSLKPYKPCQNEHVFDRENGEKREKRCKFDQKIPMKILFHYPPALPSI